MAVTATIALIVVPLFFTGPMAIMQGPAAAFDDGLRRLAAAADPLLTMCACSASNDQPY